ncbi:hypothetical protein VNO77_39871 [Canavalia gladiata]|uniref:Uncharacterized protein n=1 Tax=Canavalia gladiata TaxID=3824 RepID=A0AAN9JX08_CANGL
MLPNRRQFVYNYSARENQSGREPSRAESDPKTKAPIPKLRLRLNRTEAGDRCCGNELTRTTRQPRTNTLSLRLFLSLS